MHTEEATVYHAILTGALVLSMMILIFVITVIHYQQRKIALHKTRVKAEINALEKERARIASDLHDDLGGSLSAIKLRLQCLSISDDTERALMEESESYIDEAMLKLKRISFNMLPRVLERSGLQEALRRFIDMIEQAACIQTNFRYACPLLNEEKTVHIYRMVQEIVNNIIKHAHATQMTIELSIIKKNIQVHINDNGKGFDKDSIIKKSMGQGLHNIMARVDLLNAKLFLTTEAGGGTDYLIQIPETT